MSVVAVGRFGSNFVCFVFTTDDYIIGNQLSRVCLLAFCDSSSRFHHSRTLFNGPSHRG